MTEQDYHMYAQSFLREILHRVNLCVRMLFLTRSDAL